MQNGSDYQKIEIFLAGRQLRDLDVFSKSDPFVIVFIKQNNHWIKIGQTETINNNLNPNFQRVFQLDYIFEVVQPIRFEVRDDDGSSSDLIGVVETTIGNLFGARNQTSILELGQKNGKLVVRCDKVQEGNEVLIMKWSGIKLMNTDGWFGKSDPFLRFFRQRDDQTYIQIFETEVVMDNLNPLWKVFEIATHRISTSNDKKIKIECWDWEKSGKNQFIGEVQTSITELQQSREFILNNPKHKSPGKLRLDQFNKYIKPNFQDYIRGGLQLNLIVAVDFTGSNGQPHLPNSLHYRNQMGLNQYQTAINAVGEILLAYDFDKLVPCYGFGAQLNYPTMRTNQVNHCFPLSGDPNQINGFQLQGIASLYNYALGYVNLSGPTYFGPIISEVMRSVYQTKDQNVYNILLILTDGVIHDMQQTKQLIVDSARLPYSIIIIGVGNEDFSQMEELDGDQGLYSGTRKAERDLVQFVPFRNFQGNQVNLARHVLAEIPDQIVNYHLLVGKQPYPPTQVDINQLGMTVHDPQIPQQPNLPPQLPQVQQPNIPSQIQQVQQPNIYQQQQSNLYQQPQVQQPQSNMYQQPQSNIYQQPQQQYPPQPQQQYPPQQPYQTPSQINYQNTMQFSQNQQQYQGYPQTQQQQYQPGRQSEQIQPNNMQYQQQSSLQRYGTLQQPTQQPNHQYPPMGQSFQQQQFGNVKNPME